MLRRTFLQTLPAAAAAIQSAAAEEVPVKLGFDTYSLRAFKWKGTQLGLRGRPEVDTHPVSALADYGPLEPQRQVKDGRSNSEFPSIAEWAASAIRQGLQ
jgi:hypothetical protein